MKNEEFTLAMLRQHLAHTQHIQQMGDTHTLDAIDSGSKKVKGALDPGSVLRYWGPVSWIGVGFGGGEEGFSRLGPPPSTSFRVSSTGEEAMALLRVQVAKREGTRSCEEGTLKPSFDGRLDCSRFFTYVWRMFFLYASMVVRVMF